MTRSSTKRISSDLDDAIARMAKDRNISYVEASRIMAEQTIIKEEVTISELLLKYSQSGIFKESKKR
jgi:hypothetical protein